MSESYSISVKTQIFRKQIWFLLNSFFQLTSSHLPKHIFIYLFELQLQFIYLFKLQSFYCVLAEKLSLSDLAAFLSLKSG